MIDFGLATYSDKRLHYSILGTRPYRSPEMILQKGWSYETDIWSVGCTLLELYCGYQVFNSKTTREQLLKFETVLGKLPKMYSENERYFSHAGYVICEMHRDFDAIPLHVCY